MSSFSSALRWARPALLLVVFGLCLVLPAAAVFDSASFNAGSGDLELLAINPAGEDVPAGRELVLRFNRPVVPVGRMERESAEIPVEISPALDCEWRWLDTANLACRLGEKSEMRPATRYTVTVRPGIKAEDGATLAKTFTHTFLTARPLVADYEFSSWRSPGMPVILVRFNQPVSAASAAQHLYFASKTEPRLAAKVVEDRDHTTRRRSEGGGEYEETEEGAVTISTPPAQEQVYWLISPQQEFPLDSAIELRVEPGIAALQGPERGIEARTVVAFQTFPEFVFLGVRCDTNEKDGWFFKRSEIFFAPGQQPKSGQFCSPHSQVDLLFSAPVAPRVLNEALRMIPERPKAELTEWEESDGEQDYAVSQPHAAGRRYSMTLPYWFDAYQPYTVMAGAAALRDIFDRPLPQGIRQMFFTDHYLPSFSFGHRVSVLEKGVASEVPIEIRNLTRLDLNGASLTTTGKTDGLKRSLLFDQDQDHGFRVPLELRQLLGAPSGAVAGYFDTVPKTSRDDDRSDRTFFAQITPFNVQAKVGHFNTLVWVTDFATGQPVEGVEVKVYRATFPGLLPSPEILARGKSDRNGLVVLPGTEQLDPQLEILNGWRNTDDDLFIRCDKGSDLALLPLISDFSTRQYYVMEEGYGYGGLNRKFGHVSAWGATAQGVYRAGDTIQFKFFVRNQDNRTLVAPPKTGYSLKVVDPMDQSVHTIEKLTLSEFGAYSGEFTVPASAPVGWYRFELTSDFGGSWEPMRVLVSDFTPSPFRVMSELNGELFRAGETVKVATHARLHAGGPYADAGSRVVARLYPTGFSSKDPKARDFEFDTSSQNGEIQTIHESEAPVDGAGDRATTFRLDAANVLYGRLVVESAVRDDRGKYVAGESSARFVGRDRFVGLHQPDWILRQGKPAQLEALVVNELGNLVAGTKVEIVVSARETTASRVKGAGNAYLTHYDHRWVEVARSTLTPGAAAASMTFTPDRPGLYNLIATINDTAGRQHRTTIERWAAGSGAVVWEGGDDSALKIIPEKQELKVGDKARYLVQNPFPGAKALITVERYGVLKSWVETFNESTAIVEVPVEADYVPGFYLSVTVFSPRVDKPMEGQVDLGKPAFRIGTVATPVRDPYKELVVIAKPERTTYKPREKVTVDLQVATRQKGKLPSTELAVVVLDEAVLDLIQGGRNYYDVYKGFYNLEPLDLRTYNLLLQLVGRQKFDKKGASPGGDGGADLAMRSLFKFVAYWNPALRTDAQGKARISFEVPDNLTGWRVLVLAVTPGDRMGLGDGTFQVNRPTELRPALPNQVTEGDRFSAGFTVMNRTATERTLKVKLSAEGALAEPALLEQSVVAPPYKRVELRLPIVTKGSGEVKLTARAYDASDGDLTVATVPVRKQIVTETAATYGTTTAAQVEERILVPKDIRTDVGSVSVVTSPTVIGNIEGAFAYLRDYPYICWEQKLTKGVMASHYGQLRPWLPTTFSWPEAQGLPEVTLALAAAHQAPNGGMVYYVPEDQYVSPYLSAYTALGFNWLRAAGHAVPQGVEAKLHNYLRELLRRDEVPSFYDRGMASTVRAVALAALAPSGKVSRADAERFRSHLLEMSLFGKAHYLSALVQIPGTETLRAEVAKAILAHADQSGGKFIFSETLGLGYVRIHSSPIRDNAAILSALVAYGETPEGARLVGDVPFKLVRAITQGRGQRDRWENTQENMFCLNALIEYSRLYEKDKPAMAVRAYLDKTAIGATNFSAFTDPPQTFVRPLDAADPGRKATVKLEKDGPGRLYYATRLTWAPLEFAAKPANAGIEIRREYSVERSGKWALLSSPMQIRSGELVRVDLFLSLPAARNFVVVDDPIPGGLEPVNRDLATTSNVDADKANVPYAGASWWFHFNDWHEYGYSFWSFYHRELRHEAARFYSEYLPPGNYHLSYTAQAIAPGDFLVMPAKAEEMYDPDVFGRTVPARLKVER